MSEFEAWLEYAREDVRMAELALANGMFRQTCLHSQQAAEKALKGLLVVRLGTHPKGHSLEELLHFHESVREELWGWRDRLAGLDGYYLPTRYPDAWPGLLAEREPSEVDAEVALRNAKAFVAEIAIKIGGKK